MSRQPTGTRFQALYNRDVPCHDGGGAFGQAALAEAEIAREKQNMCLAVAAKVVEVRADGTAVVDVKGNRLEVNIALAPEVTPENYVLVHAGFAISVVDREEYELQHRIFDEIVSYAQIALDETRPEQS